MTTDEDRSERPEGVADYDGPAGGWGALRAVAVAVRDQMGATRTRARCCR